MAVSDLDAAIYIPVLTLAVILFVVVIAYMCCVRRRAATSQRLFTPAPLYDAPSISLADGTYIAPAYVEITPSFSGQPPNASSAVAMTGAEDGLVVDSLYLNGACRVEDPAIFCYMRCTDADANANDVYEVHFVYQRRLALDAGTYELSAYHNDGKIATRVLNVIPGPRSMCTPPVLAGATAPPLTLNFSSSHEKASIRSRVCVVARDGEEETIQSTNGCTEVVLSDPERYSVYLTSVLRCDGEEFVGPETRYDYALLPPVMDTPVIEPPSGDIIASRTEIMIGASSRSMMASAGPGYCDIYYELTYVPRGTQWSLSQCTSTPTVPYAHPFTLSTTPPDTFAVVCARYVRRVDGAPGPVVWTHYVVAPHTLPEGLKEQIKQRTPVKVPSAPITVLPVTPPPKPDTPKAPQIPPLPPLPSLPDVVVNVVSQVCSGAATPPPSRNLFPGAVESPERPVNSSVPPKPIVRCGCRDVLVHLRHPDPTAALRYTMNGRTCDYVAPFPLTDTTDLHVFVAGRQCSAHLVVSPELTKTRKVCSSSASDGCPPPSVMVSSAGVVLTMDVPPPALATSRGRDIYYKIYSSEAEAQHSLGPGGHITRESAGVALYTGPVELGNPHNVHVRARTYESFGDTSSSSAAAAASPGVAWECSDEWSHTFSMIDIRKPALSPRQVDLFKK
eukprot:PhM_4_TR2885/c0_g1_i1/m.44398